MTAQLKTVDGGTVTNHRAAFMLVNEIMEAAGFKLVSASQQSCSAYYARPESPKSVIRVSDHANHNPGMNEKVIEARLTTVREEIISTWVDEIEGEIEEREFMNVIAQSPAEIEKIIADAISVY